MFISLFEYKWALRLLRFHSFTWLLKKSLLSTQVECFLLTSQIKLTSYLRYYSTEQACHWHPNTDGAVRTIQDLTVQVLHANLSMNKILLSYYKDLNFIIHSGMIRTLHCGYEPFLPHGSKNSSVQFRSSLLHLRAYSCITFVTSL